MKKPILSLLLGATVFAQPGVDNVRVEVKDVTIQTPPKPGAPVLAPKRRMQAPVPPAPNFDVFVDHAGVLPKPVIILSGKQESKITAEINEDMAIMTKLISDSLADDFSREGKGSAMGIVLRMKERRSPNLFIEGHGAIFFVDAGIALSASPDKEKKREDGADKPPSAWEEARRELFGKNRGHFNWEDSELEFDAGKVEKLKGVLTEALQQGANIRHLKPDDFLTIVVNGPGAGKVLNRTITKSQQVPMENGNVLLLEAAEGDPARVATMVLRVKRADIESSNKEQENSSEFAKKVSISVY